MGRARRGRRARLGAVGLANRDSPVEADDRAVGDSHQFVVPPDDLNPSPSAVALRCPQLNLLKRTVSVVETASFVSGKLNVGPPKTKASIRTIPVPAPVAEVLEAHLSNLGLSGQDVVFPGPGGGHIRMNNWQRRHWFPALEAAGFESIAMHQLRHTGITRWVQSGLDLVTVARRAGHESVRTVADIYARSIEGETAADELVSERAAAVIAAATRSRSGHAEVTEVNSRSVRKARKAG